MKSDLPDNYVEEGEFLSQLKLNETVKKLEYHAVARNATAIAQEISIIIIFVVLFFMTYQNQLTSSMLLSIDAIFLLIGIFFDFLVSQGISATTPSPCPAPQAVSSASHTPGTETPTITPSHSSNSSESVGAPLVALIPHPLAANAQSTHRRQVSIHRGPSHKIGHRSVTRLYVEQPPTDMARMGLTKGVYLGVCLLCLSPVLSTLTDQFSDDTIAFLSFLLLVARMYTFDYPFVNGDRSTFRGTLATNVGFLTAILLASRLPTTLHVFALLALSTELFVLFPYVRRTVQCYSLEAHLMLTWVLFVLAAALLMPISRFGSAAVRGLRCPYWLTWLQKFKAEIHGPWDEARVTLTAPTETPLPTDPHARQHHPCHVRILPGTGGTEATTTIGSVAVTSEEVVELIRRGDFGGPELASLVAAISALPALSSPPHPPVVAPLAGLPTVLSAVPRLDEQEES
ncbi:putative phosphatidylinositol N-acetylglucosaminyltransferase [Paratrimastix pyriformis]|uniref:Phosphatidylinositol N-acetylglucosaminyltransferase n=1 Tax=Paratrimastix pyriformis TaxID=342808 RepID=A0ABQ8UW40_9EUKA|nr:putative phosphatidylinositol N-acetylglucosaminyltransferase [Paratrimastix pyriformis]